LSLYVIFCKKSPIIDGSFAETDLQLKASYASSPPSIYILIAYNFMDAIRMGIGLGCQNGSEDTSYSFQPSICQPTNLPFLISIVGLNPKNMLQCVEVCCSVLQCCNRTAFSDRPPILISVVGVNPKNILQCVAVCCSVLQCVAVCCSVLQCCNRTAFSDRPPIVISIVGLNPKNMLQCVAVCCSVLKCVAVCCSVAIGLHSQTDLLL